MRLPYSEGTSFVVPLRQGGFAVGVVARASAAGKVILCYFFGPSRTSIPSLADVDKLELSDAVLVVRVGDLSLMDGDWPIVGPIASWNRFEWPMPIFVRKDPLSHRAWRVQYSDKDPRKIEGEESEPYESTLERDAVYGAGAAEILLTNLLEIR